VWPNSKVSVKPGQFQTFGRRLPGFAASQCVRTFSAVVTAARCSNSRWALLGKAAAPRFGRTSIAMRSTSTSASRSTSARARMLE
jgi:hypothetical protein